MKGDQIDLPPKYLLSKSPAMLGLTRKQNSESVALEFFLSFSSTLLLWLKMTPVSVIDPENLFSKSVKVFKL